MVSSAMAALPMPHDDESGRSGGDDAWSRDDQVSATSRGGEPTRLEDNYAKPIDFRPSWPPGPDRQMAANASVVGIPGTGPPTITLSSINGCLLGRRKRWNGVDDKISADHYRLPGLIPDGIVRILKGVRGGVSSRPGRLCVKKCLPCVTEIPPTPDADQEPEQRRQRLR